jgi:hypothetical protein
MRFYLGSKFYMSPLIGREPVALGIAPAIRQVMRMRMDTWWGCNRLARIGVIDPGWEDLCPFYTDMEMDLPLEVPETTVHAILECPAWAMQREQFLQQAIGDIHARLREVHTRAVTEQRLEYQNLDEGEWNLLRGLFVGQPFGDVLPNHFAGTVSSWRPCSGDVARVVLPLYMLWLMRGGVVFTSRQNTVVLRHT